MEHDGTAKIAAQIKKELGKYSTTTVEPGVFKDANTTPEQVYQYLGGYVANIDMTQPGHGGFQFHSGCAHSEVVDEYTRLGPSRYRAVTTCCRCNQRIGEVTRIGGESASRKRFARPFHVNKQEPEAQEKGKGKGWAHGKGGGEEEEGSEGQGGESTGDGEEQEGEGKNRGGGKGEEGEGGGEEKSESGENGEDKNGEGGSQGEGEETDETGSKGKGEEGHGEGEGDGEGDSEGGGKDKESPEGGARGVQDSCEDAEQPPPANEDYIAAFKRHWNKMPADQKPGIYQRLVLLHTEEGRGWV